jgi:hypothetical protein
MCSRRCGSGKWPRDSALSRLGCDQSTDEGVTDGRRRVLEARAPPHRAAPSTFLAPVPPLRAPPYPLLARVLAARLPARALAVRLPLAPCLHREEARGSLGHACGSTPGASAWCWKTSCAVRGTCSSSLRGSSASMLAHPGDSRKCSYRRPHLAAPENSARRGRLNSGDATRWCGRARGRDARLARPADTSWRCAR